MRGEVMHRGGSSRTEMETSIQMLYEQFELCERTHDGPGRQRRGGK